MGVVVEIFVAARFVKLNEFVERFVILAFVESRVGMVAIVKRAFVDVNPVALSVVVEIFVAARFVKLN